MAKCMSCGFDKNRPGAKFCSNCGARLTFLAPGDVLQGRYEIIDVLGKGGMGAICLAEDRQALGSKCVIKEMIDYFNPADPNEVRKAQQRFEDEARTLAQLNHPSIPDVRQFFSEAGRNYLVMEFVEGENLEERIAREAKPLPQEEVIQYTIQVCRVLEYLGAQQPPLVHHDIKPANIVVNKEANAISLVDFGTAKTRFVQMGGQLGQGRSSVYGTVGYAPPEQYGDKPQTEPRSDVYALGATLYYLLTNDDPSDHPFHFPELSKLPAAIRKVLEGSLNPDVHQRPTATQMRQALEATGIKTAPFHFRSGATAHNVAELVELCDRHWEDAKFHFYRGDFENWLRTSLHHTDLESEASRIRQSYSDQDEGLEALLHRLDPNLPVPVLQVDPPTLDFKRMKEGEVKQDRLSITNAASRGYLCGKISVDPPAPWLSVPDRFQGNQVALDVEVNAAEQPEGTRLTTKLGLETEYEPPVEVPIRARVAFGWRRFIFDVLGATLVSTAIWLVMTHLIQQALAQGLSEDFDLLLAGYASVGAVVLALIIGFRRGVSRDFSRLGFLVGAAVGFLAVGYVSLGMAVEFLLLSKAGGEQLALISLVTLGAFIGLLVGLHLGLRHARRPALAVALPTGLFTCGAFVVGWLGNFTVYTHNYLVSETLIPVVSFAPPGLSLTISTPTPVPPMPTPVSPTTTATRISTSQAVVTANALHLRAGPGNAYGIISVLAKGTKMAVLGRSSDSAWLQVHTSSGQIGWVFTRLVSLNVALGDIPTIPMPPTPTPSPRATPARRQATLTPPSDIVIVRPHCSNPRVQMSQVRINQRTREVEIIGTAATASFAYFRIQLKPAHADWRTAGPVSRQRVKNGLLFRDTLPAGSYRLALEVADAREEIPQENRCETSISVP